MRTLRRSPGFSLTAILSVALSAGITAVVFAAVQAVLLDPLPFAKPEELVQIATDHVGTPPSLGDYAFYNDAALYGLRPSASLFPMLGVSPMQGRNILPEEDGQAQQRW